MSQVGDPMNLQDIAPLFHDVTVAVPNEAVVNFSHGNSADNSISKKRAFKRCLRKLFIAFDLVAIGKMLNGVFSFGCHRPSRFIANS